MTITNLGDTTSDQLRLLLESNEITITKSIKDRFIIKCPKCNKNEGYIYFNQKSRVLICNRENNCDNEVSLWDYIANKRGIDLNNGLEMLKYINQTLGLEFSQTNIEQYNKLQEERNKKQEFFIHCNQIFSNALRDASTPQSQFSLNYLNQTRKYTEEHIKDFGLGFFPDYKDLIDKLVKDYNYEKDTAEIMTLEHFGNIIGVNGRATSEEQTQRITITYYDKEDKIAGFIIRKPAEGTEKDKKYQYNQGMHKTHHLFNLNNLRFKNRLVRSLVIVEGQLDALAASHMRSQDIADLYHFVASGGNSLSDQQAQLLKNKQFSQVTFFIDNDKAGENFPKSVAKLREYDITSFVVSIPKDYKDIKDIDQLLTEHPDVDLYAILENKKSAIEAELDIIKKSCSKDQNNVKPDERDRIIRECKRLNGKLLDSEVSQYKEYMKSNFDIDEPILNVKAQEVKMGIENNKPRDDIRLKLQEFQHEVQQKMVQEVADIQEGRTSSLDINDLRNKSYELKKLILQSNVSEDSSDKQSNSKMLANILTNVETFGTLLTVNPDADKPYTSPQLLEKVANSPQGMATGFKDLDKNVSIQPASLVFIAGKPSHGKTRTMINLCLNMIKGNPNKAFLFYSYEEDVQQIWAKLILANIKLKPGGLTKRDDGSGYLGAVFREMRTTKMTAIERDNSGNILMPSDDHMESFNEIMQWIEEGRLQILDRKPNVEILSGAIIERVQSTRKSDSFNKETGAIFVDYVQKLNTNESKANRQQELQKICQTLLNTAMDKRVSAAIILGAQVNRAVKSLSTLDMSSMREAADIEQDANLILGIWDERAAELDRLRSKLADIDDALFEGELNEKSESYGTSGKNSNQNKPSWINKEKLENQQRALKTIIEEKENAMGITISQIKILKNRNGKKDVVVNLTCHPDRFLLHDAEADKNTSKAERNSAIDRIKEMAFS